MSNSLPPTHSLQHTSSMRSLRTIKEGIEDKELFKAQAETAEASPKVAEGNDGSNIRPSPALKWRYSITERTHKGCISQAQAHHIADNHRRSSSFLTSSRYWSRHIYQLAYGFTILQDKVSGLSNPAVATSPIQTAASSILHLQRRSCGRL